MHERLGVETDSSKEVACLKFARKGQYGETWPHARSRRTFAAPDLEDRLDEVLLKDAESPALSSKTSRSNEIMVRSLWTWGEAQQRGQRTCLCSDSDGKNLISSDVLPWTQCPPGASEVAMLEVLDWVQGGVCDGREVGGGSQRGVAGG